MTYQTSPQITQLTNGDLVQYAGRLYHVLPTLAVSDDPGVWNAVIRLLVDRGLSREEALTRIRFAYTGQLDGDLPPGVE